MRDVLRVIGLASPAAIAYATYAFFQWLDRNASAQASRAISAWLKGQPYTRIDMQHAILDLFDRVYTSPLFRLRALFRSSIISITIFVSYQLYLARLYTDFWAVSYVGPLSSSVSPLSLLALQSAIFAVLVIVSDYLSLFLIRWFLITVIARPFFLIVSALLYACITIVAIFTAGLFVISFVRAFRAHGFGPGPEQYLLDLTIIMFSIDFFHAVQIFESFMAPALLVNVWLLLFAVGALGAQMVYLAFRAVGWAQWFFKQGNRHPVRSIGIVAAGLVFILTLMGKLASVLF